MSQTLKKNRSASRYVQVKTFITDRINKGEWNVGYRLPSENELVEQLGISRMTVHRALRELTADGIVTRAQGLAPLWPNQPNG